MWIEIDFIVDFRTMATSRIWIRRATNVEKGVATQQNNAWPYIYYGCTHRPYHRLLWSPSTSTLLHYHCAWRLPMNGRSGVCQWIWRWPESYGWSNESFPSAGSMFQTWLLPL